MNASHIPVSNVDTEPYWEGVRRGALLFQRCIACGEPVFHPRPLCPYCLSDQLSWERSAGMGAIYSYTIQRVPLVAGDASWSPIALGIIALDEGYHMFSEIRFCADMSLGIGSRVKVWFDEGEGNVVLPKFEVIV